MRCTEGRFVSVVSSIAAMQWSNFDIRTERAVAWLTSTSSEDWRSKVVGPDGFLHSTKLENVIVVEWCTLFWTRTKVPDGIIPIVPVLGQVMVQCRN